MKEVSLGKWLILLLIVGLCAGMVASYGCGGGDDDDGRDDDDDTGDDDSGDDDSGDDDDDSDYDSLICDLPDPEGIGEMIGGGAIGDTITVYVFDDKDCDPIAGASVIWGGDTVETGADGKAVLDMVDGAEMVTAHADGYFAWSYEADAAVMYFRLRPVDYGYSYSDSAEGDFLLAGSPVGLTNPSVTNILQIGNLINNPIYAGVAFPGVSRNSIFSGDYEAGFLAESTFQIELDGFADGGTDDDPVDVPKNVYLPDLTISISILGLDVLIETGNNTFKIPTKSGTNPAEGLVAKVELSEVLDTELLLDIIQVLIEGGEITDVLIPLIFPLVNDGLTFNFVAANPDWDGSGAPDLDLIEVGPAVANMNISSPSASYDYLGVLVGDIPHRALLPMSLSVADAGGFGQLAYSEVPSADYAAIVARTDLFASELESFNMSFVAQYFDNAADLAGGVSVSNSDFLPNIDNDSSEYNDTTGEISWDLAKGDSKATLDVFFLIYVPACEGCPWVFSVVPGDARSYQPPIDELGITPDGLTPDEDDEDIIVLLGFDLPSGVSADEFSPTSLIAYDSFAYNLWTNIDIIGLIGGL